MTLSRRSFLASLAGLPILGRVMQRAPLPSDTVFVGYNVPYEAWNDSLITITNNTTLPEWERYEPQPSMFTREELDRMVTTLNADYRRKD